MITTLQKSALRDGYYYSGYILQNACVITHDQPKIIGMWDASNDCFTFWEYEANRKTAIHVSFMNDIDNMDEISYGFIPMNEMTPKQDHIVE